MQGTDISIRELAPSFGNGKYLIFSYMEIKEKIFL